jgi:hypothetical protein
MFCEIVIFAKRNETMNKLRKIELFKATLSQDRDDLYVVGHN